MSTDQPPPDHQTSPALIKDNLVPIITPLTESCDVDVQAINRLVAFHKSLGTGALFAVGGMGRFTHLNDDQRVKAAEAFVSANRRMGSPLVIFTGATSETAEGTLENLVKMSSFGADAVFVAPLYFLSPTDIPDFFRRARERLGQKMPLLLYNNPDFSRCAGPESKNLDVETLRVIANDVSAVKDSSCDPDLFSRYASVGVPMYTGNEPALVDHVRRRHSRGSVGGLGNITSTPGLLARQLAALTDEGDETKVAELSAKFDAEVATLNEVIRAHPDVPSADVVTAVFHYCLAEAGLVQVPEEVKVLTEADKSRLRDNGFIPHLA